MAINMTGPDMHLACPKGSYNITDFSWQLASRLRYNCWDGKHHQQLLDYLVSPANGLDKIDTNMIARGDGPIAPAYLQEQQQKQKFWQTKQATIAGAVVGVVVGVVLFSVLIWFIVGRRIMATRKAQSFQKYEDDHVAAAAGDTASGAPASTQADPVSRGVSSAGAHM
jgi:flagellar biosynthesis/type III secretory pathway M-ring protein FliF/YscJ